MCMPVRSNGSLRLLASLPTAPDGACRPGRRCRPALAPLSARCSHCEVLHLPHSSCSGHVLTYIWEGAREEARAGWDRLAVQAGGALRHWRVAAVCVLTTSPSPHVPAPTSTPTPPHLPGFLRAIPLYAPVHLVPLLLFSASRVRVAAALRETGQLWRQRKKRPGVALWDHTAALLNNS